MSREKTVEKPTCLIVGGPTGSGKTATAICLAQQLGGEIINCDSMQIYRGLDIGTAKPTAAEQAAIPHHLIDILDPGQSFSVAEYVRLAEQTAIAIAGRGKLPIFCGGTGQYISALLQGYTYRELPYDPKLRAKLWTAAKDPKQYAAMLAELEEADPDHFATVPPTNQKRIIRAIEIQRLTGKTVTALNRESRRQKPTLSCRLFVISHERQVLYERINQRVLQMLDQGLLIETEALLKLNLPATATCLQAIGYKEIFPFLRGERSLQEVTADLQQASRRYAKRQLTWFRNQTGGDWILDQGPEQAAATIISLLAEPSCYLA